MKALFESFNARSLSPSEVSRSFVPPSFLNQILRRNNCLLIGPRGSGKTTLFKMIQQDALESWAHPAAPEYIKYVDYTCVLIPTDYRWHQQMTVLSCLQEDSAISSRLLSSVFATHAFQCFTESVMKRFQRHSSQGIRAVNSTPLSKESEYTLIKLLSKAMRVEPEIYSLRALLYALENRRVELRETMNRISLMDLSQAKLTIANHAYLNLPYLDVLQYCIRCTNDMSDNITDKWMLAYDELELIPTNLQDEILTSLRSVSDDRLTFKLALSPTFHNTNHFSDALRAMPGHDYEEVKLWYSDLTDSRPFCNALWSHMAAARELEDPRPEVVLGLSFTEENRKDQSKAYAPTGTYDSRIRDGIKYDWGLQRYLGEQKISIEALEQMTDSQRAAKLRKVFPVLPLRLFYLKSSQTAPSKKAVGRSRKVPDLYSGRDLVFSSTDGNPRWFIWLAGRLLDSIDSSGRVKRQRQAKIMQAAASRYLYKLASEPLRDLPAGIVLNKSLSSFVWRIGNTLHQKLLVSPIPKGFVTTFTVDERLTPEDTFLLKVAVYEGAVVYLPGKGDPLVLENLLGKRFRLTHRLAAFFGLILRNEESMPLADIMKGKESTESVTDGHPRLFS